MGLLMSVSIVRFSISSSITRVAAKTITGNAKRKTNDDATSRYILKSSLYVKNPNLAATPMAHMPKIRMMYVKGWSRAS